MTHSVTEFISFFNYKAVCRRAQATPALLNIFNYLKIERLAYIAINLMLVTETNLLSKQKVFHCSLQTL